MKSPKEKDMKSLLKAKEAAFSYLRIPRPLKHNLVLGQYSGYKKEKHIPARSTTPTFMAMKLDIVRGPLKGVPVFIRTGKALKDRFANIVIEMHDEHAFFSDEIVKGNKFVVQIQPFPKLITIFNHRTPDLEFGVERVFHSFSKMTYFKKEGRNDYERIFSGVIQGERRNGRFRKAR